MLTPHLISTHGVLEATSIVATYSIALFVVFGLLVFGLGFFAYVITGVGYVAQALLWVIDSKIPVGTKLAQVKALFRRVKIT